MFNRNYFDRTYKRYKVTQTYKVFFYLTKILFDNEKWLQMQHSDVSILKEGQSHFLSSYYFKSHMRAVFAGRIKWYRRLMQVIKPTMKIIEKSLFCSSLFFLLSNDLAYGMNFEQISLAVNKHAAMHKSQETYCSKVLDLVYINMHRCCHIKYMYVCQDLCGVTCCIPFDY